MASLAEKIESPFTWNIEENYAFTYDETELSEEDEVPFLALMNSIMKTFIYVTKVNFNEAQKSIKATDDIWNKLDQEQLQADGISTKTLYKVIQDTKKYVPASEHEDNHDTIKKLDESPLIELDEVSSEHSTLLGCKSAAWSIFYESAMDLAISFVRAAIDINVNCSVWHFILGKNLRRLRREHGIRNSPSSEEIECFHKAYTLYKSPLYGIYLAHAYHENNDRLISNNYYREVYYMRPKSCKVLLRLALGFLRTSNLQNAKSTLEYVETLRPESSMLFHYKGIYYMKCNNLELACEYFRKAAVYGNFGADLQYGLCMKQLDDSFSFIYHMMFMLKKYGGRYRQQLTLHMGFEYFKNEKYEKAFVKFLEAIEVMPYSKTLQQFLDPNGRDSINVFDFIDSKLLPTYKENCPDFMKNQQTLEKYENLKKLLKIRIEEGKSAASQMKNKRYIKVLILILLLLFGTMLLLVLSHYTNCIYA